MRRTENGSEYKIRNLFFFVEFLFEIFYLYEYLVCDT